MYPLHPTQDLAIFDDVLVCREKYLEIARPDLALECPALERVALVRDHLHAGCPFGELAGPIRHGRKRDNDEVRSTLTFRLNQERDEGDRLNGLAETLARRTCQCKGSSRWHAVLTISSARIPFSLLLYKLTIHCRPLIWYSLSVPPISIPGCLVTFSLTRCATA